MTPRTRLAAVVLAATSLLSGCTAAGVVAPDPTRSAEASAPAGDRAFGGDCASVISPLELDTLVEGAGGATASIPVGHPDGLVCSWQGSSRSLTVRAISKRDAAPAEIARLTLPECDPATGFCGGGIEAGGLWIVVDFGFVEGEWEPVVSTALKAVANAAEAHG
ncbi:hypothetical protein [Microbacterium sp.]|uniref:hypothetical protein n=1 Tax=Microbacterium sp. TaxID=51671 RepID=UPI003F6ED670